MTAAPNDVFTLALRLGDQALVLGQRLSAWTGHGPILEEDMAMTNIALDLFGQARGYLTYAGEVEGLGRDEDALAFLRDAYDFTNPLLCEQPNGDFGQTMARQFLFDAYHVPLLEGLARSADQRLAAVAAKASREARYHLEHSSRWVIRLGDGTEESHARLAAGVSHLWRFTDELFEEDDVHRRLLEAEVAAPLAPVRDAFDATVSRVFAEAGLSVPQEVFMVSGGRLGQHGEALGLMLAEMQFLPRAYPGATW